MLFYRVKKGAPDCFFWNVYTRRCIGNLISGELYTAKEMEKRGFSVYVDYFEPVEISKRATYWCFGRRYALADLDNRK